MSIELKTLPTGEVVLRNEEDAKALFVEVLDCMWCVADHFCAETRRVVHKTDEYHRDLPESYPCLAEVKFDKLALTRPVYIYLSDAEAMVSALKEAGATPKPEAAFCLEAIGGPELVLQGLTLSDWQEIQESARDEIGFGGDVVIPDGAIWATCTPIYDQPQADEGGGPGGWIFNDVRFE